MAATAADAPIPRLESHAEHNIRSKRLHSMSLPNKVSVHERNSKHSGSLGRMSPRAHLQTTTLPTSKRRRLGILVGWQGCLQVQHADGLGCGWRRLV